MRKLSIILFVLLSIISTSIAQIVGIEEVKSIEGKSVYTSNDKISWQYNRCSQEILVINFVKNDHYYLKNENEWIQDLGTIESLTIDPEGNWMFEVDNNGLMIYNYFGNGTDILNADIYSDSDGFIANFIISEFPRALKYLHFDLNFAYGEGEYTEISMCDQNLEFIYPYVDYIDYDYGVLGGNNCFDVDDAVAFYINGVKKASKDLSRLSFKDGDTLNVGRLPKLLYGCRCIYPEVLAYSDTLFSNSFIMKGCPVITDLEAEKVVSAYSYPNPVVDVLNFTIGEGTVMISNQLGQFVQSFANTKNINVEHLEKGVYHFKINSENKITRGWFVKE